MSISKRGLKCAADNTFAKFWRLLHAPSQISGLSHKGHLSNTVWGTKKDEGVGRSSDSGLLRPTCILFICSPTAVWIIICINAQFPLVLGTLSRPRTAPKEDLPGRRNMCTIRRQVQPLSSTAEGIVQHGGCLSDTEVLIMPLSICQSFFVSASLCAASQNIWTLLPSALEEL